MDTPERIIAHCPACRTAHRFSAAMDGKTAVCKNCGVTFLVGGKDSSGNGAAPAEEQPGEAGSGSRPPEDADRRMSAILAQDRDFIRLVLAKNWTDRATIDNYLLEQKKIFDTNKVIAPIGHLLVSAGAITSEQHQKLLAALAQVQATSPPTTAERSEEGGITGFEVMIAESKLRATIRATQEARPDVTVEEIKLLLRSKGVVHGLMPDEQLAGYLRGDFRTQGIIRVAEGQAPVAGQESTVQYYFDTDPLGTRKRKDGQVVDLRDLGEIPQVKQGALLAERTLGQEGISGMDVLGRVIPAPKTKDVKFHRGEGVEISPDGLKAHAKIDGRPQLSADGTLYVFPDLVIEGDVDFKTGHIDFEGRVEVRGTVLDGFRIKCGTLEAREIKKCEIEVAGNVLVKGGIIGANLKAGGAVAARYVQEANIQALGDVVVEKDVFLSNVETSGSLTCGRGNILGSTVAAKKGVEAAQVGSEMSRPSTVVIGIDIQVLKMVKELRGKLLQNIEWLEKQKPLRNGFIQKSDRLSHRLGELSLVYEQAETQLGSLKQAWSQTPDTEENKPRREKIVKALRRLTATTQEANGQMLALLDEQDAVVEKIMALQDELTDIEKENVTISEEINRLIKWSQQEKSHATIKVTGQIFNGTVVKGPHSSLTLANTIGRVSLMEVNKTSPDSKTGWEIDIVTLR